MAKSYFAKIYQPNGDYLDTLKDVNFSGFRKQINGGLGELSLSIPKKFDDFDENYLIKLNNRVDLWVNDNDTGTDGLKIYSGFISQYEPSIQGQEESVTIRCLGYVSKLATSILKNGTQIELKTDTTSGLTTGDTASAVEVSDVVKAVIDRFQVEANNPIVDYSSIDDSGNTMTYTFNAKYYMESIEKCREFAPANWWWYVGADNILNFKAKPSQATHTFVFGKHFKSVKVEKNMENVVNKVLFSSGDNTDQQILKLYEDTDSVDSFDDRWKIITDNRVSVSETADNVGQSTISEKKDVEIKTTVEILDNNGKENSGYDIESIQPGDTCKFVGFNDITSLTFTDNMHILGIQYTPDSVVLEIENLNPSIARENWENKRKIAEQEASGRASSYDTDTDKWHEVGASGEPAFENSWANYGSTYQSAAFMKDSMGFVHLKGLITGGASGNTIFTLPVGYRPAKIAIFYGIGSAIANTETNISEVGLVKIYNIGGNSSLEGIVFRAEQ